MVDLLEDRFEFVFSFIFFVVDYFGSWYVKDGRRELKRYGVFFTCLFFRVIYFEVSNILIIDFFLNVYRRFVGRRGLVR